MKKLLSLGLLFFLLLSFTACDSHGKVNNVKVTIGESTKFSKDEIQKAADAVICKFKDFENCDLLSLWYDEERSNSEIQNYLLNGRGSENNAKAENVIVFFSDFYVAPNAENGFTPDSDYEGWSWILIRETDKSNWTIDAWGY